MSVWYNPHDDQIMLVKRWGRYMYKNAVMHENYCPMFFARWQWVRIGKFE